VTDGQIHPATLFCQSEQSERRFSGPRHSRILSAIISIVKPRGSPIPRGVGVLFRVLFLSDKTRRATKSQEMVAFTDSLTNAVCTTDMVPQAWEVFRVLSQRDPVVSMESIYGDLTTGLNNFFPKSPTLRATPPISLIMVICRNNSLNLVRSLAPSPFSTAMSRCRYFL
jgi:hypothetical protein